MSLRTEPVRQFRRPRLAGPSHGLPGFTPLAKSIEVSRKLYLTCLWPGLPELWWRGRLAALPTAVAFAAAFNLLLVARFVYPEWLAMGLVKIAGWVGFAVWVVLVVKSTQQLAGLISPRAVSDQPDRFADAHVAYLQGRWDEAEALFSECLAVESRDPPALLLLAGAYRKSRRWEAAERLLEEIRLTEAADRWWLEVAAETKRLERDRQRSLFPAEVSPPQIASPPNRRVTEVSGDAGQDQPRPLTELSAADVDEVVRLEPVARAA